MSFDTFMKTMLSKDMSELGFKHYKGSEWYKLIDDSVYLYVSARKLSFGGIYLYFNICSLFAEHLNKLPNVYCKNAAYLMTQDMLNRGVDIGQFGFWLNYCDEKTAKGMAAIKKGQDTFALAKQILASVHDLNSCFEAKQLAGYLSFFVSESDLLGREYTQMDYTEEPPDDAYSILCCLGKYNEAADYLHQYLANFERMQINKDFLEYETKHSTEAAMDRAQREKMIQESKDFWKPYIEMAEAKNSDRINTILLERYNNNCDLLEAKYKIKLNRSSISFN